MEEKMIFEPYNPKTLDDLRTPAFLVDRDKVRRNCERMISLCEKAGVRLRAQTKTHRTIEGALLQTGGSKSSIVTSTLSEAEFYAGAGFDDILYGYPLTSNKVTRCVYLTKSIGSFHVMIDSDHVIPSLIASSSQLEQKKWSVFLKVDCGNGRAGVWHSDDAGIDIIRQLIASPHIFTFQGIYIHCGNSYTGGGKVEAVVRETVQRALALVGRVEAALGKVVKVVGIGSTPSCSRTDLLDEFSQLTELHPGNYIFYDTQQANFLSSCTLDDISCCVMTRVIGHYERRNELLIDCGFTSLTKQCGDLAEPGLGYGVIRDHPNLKIVNMTQEIGKVTTYDKSPLPFSTLPVGITLLIYPWHSCATAGQHEVYYVVSGEEIVDVWTPNKGW